MTTVSYTSDQTNLLSSVYGPKQKVLDEPSGFKDVILDYTFGDLFAMDYHPDEELPTIIYDAEPWENNNVVQAARYIYSSPTASKGHAMRENMLAANAYAQRRLFIMGGMHVIVAGYSDGHDTAKDVVERTVSTRKQLKEAMERLPLHQRPTMEYIQASDLDNLAIDQPVLNFIPTDRISRFNLVVDQDTHFMLLSKVGLAQSGLPTPSSIVIDPVISIEDLNSPLALQAEMHRVRDILRVKPLPFVVKLAQSVGSLGTFLVRKEVDRLNLETVLSEKMPPLLKQLTYENQHLHPCSLVVQDFLQGVEYGLSFFVTIQGRAVFQCATVPRFSQDHHWTGGIVNFPDQPALAAKYQHLLDKAAQFLHAKGYWGPAGIDVLTVDKNKHYIIDLNPRFTGCHHIPLLKGHFRQRGFEAIGVASREMSCTTEEFQGAFAKELNEGRLVVSGWSYDEVLHRGYGFFTIGGEDEMQVQKLIARLVTH